MIQPKRESDVVVVGAGPAGLMAAIAASRGGERVTVCEQLDHAGAKLLASSGGRCNFANALPRAEFLKSFGSDGRFMSPAIQAFDPYALRRYFEKRGMATASPDGLHVFPASNRARDVLAVLESECERQGVQFALGSRVTKLEIAAGAVCGVKLGRRRLAAPRVIVAAGGQSYPELGGRGGGYALAQQAGHTMVEPVPALVELEAGEPWPGECAGLAQPAVRLWVDLADAPRAAAEGDLLFTHKGIAGPAALNLSGAVSRLLLTHDTVPLRLNLLPEVSRPAWETHSDHWVAREGRKHVRTLLSRHLPPALADVACAQAGGIAKIRAADLSAETRDALASWLTAAPLTVTGTAGFGHAMVTRGGVALDQVDPRTLGSKLVKGLHFAGEVLDVDGPCGGYNLQWAFSSGNLAGRSCVARLSQT